MEKIAVIYWSATGNTEAMAGAIAEGIRAENVHADLFSVSEFGARSTGEYAKLALGCPSMGAEVLEECEFEPFLCSIEPELAGKKIALFGSFGWGDGEWMRNWEERMKKDGCVLFENGLIINLTPDDEGVKRCAEFGGRFAKF